MAKELSLGIDRRGPINPFFNKDAAIVNTRKSIFSLTDGDYDFQSIDKEGFESEKAEFLYMRVYIRKSDGLICGPPKKVARLMMQTFEECLVLEEGKIKDLSILYALERFKNWTKKQKAKFAVSVIRGFAVLPCHEQGRFVAN